MNEGFNWTTNGQTLGTIMKQWNISSDNLMFRKPNFWLQLITNAMLLVIAIVSLFFIGFSFVYISTPVIGESMQPTLNPKGGYKSDVVYVNKFANYDFGDIVVIEQPDSENEYIIKRVIGMPGDTLNITLNQTTNKVELYRNEQLVNEPYLFDWEAQNEPNNNGMFTTLNNFNNLKLSHPQLFNQDGVLVVPQNNIFALGDNRGKSLDSSIKGTFSQDLVVGKVDHIVPYGQNEWVYFWNLYTPFTIEQA